MATGDNTSYTTNLNLAKPGYKVAADIGLINGNMDILDAAVAGKQKKTADQQIAVGKTCSIEILPASRILLVLIGTTNEACGLYLFVSSNSTSSRKVFPAGIVKAITDPNITVTLPNNTMGSYTVTIVNNSVTMYAYAFELAGSVSMSVE